jgi:hypothetical protein
MYTLYSIVYIKEKVFVAICNRKFVPETHTKRQATQHDCLPSLPDGDKGIEKVYGEEKQILYRAD